VEEAAAAGGGAGGRPASHPPTRIPPRYFRLTTFLENIRES